MAEKMGPRNDLHMYGFYKKGSILQNCTDSENSQIQKRNDIMYQVKNMLEENISRL